MAITSDWQMPTELPDLRRVGVVALDTETKDEGLRADRRSGLAVARRICLRRQRCLPRGRRHSLTLFPAAPPRHRQLRSRTGLRLVEGFDRVRCSLRHPERPLRLGLAAHRWRHLDAARRSPRGDRRARNPRRREPLLLRPRRALRLARPSRQRHDAAAAGDQDRGVCAEAQEDQCPGAHLATAGTLCGRLRRGRCGEHTRPLGRPRSSARSAKRRATPIGSRSICCRWCTRCAAAESASIRPRPNRRAT